MKKATILFGSTTGNTEIVADKIAENMPDYTVQVIYVTDAKNYVSSGVLHCYSREGVRKWSVRTGDIPAHMVFLERKQPQR